MSAVGEPASPRPSRLGRYELITQIGEGGMAEVQLALQRGPAGFEKLVVVKLVHEKLATQKNFVDMLLDEARVAALVKHPNVVDIYDLGEADGRFFIAMEYLEGEPLLAVLRAGRDGKRLDPLSTARLVADTAEGLDAAHELRSMSGDPIELVHHDVSLGNIVVLYSGQVKLVDFGVAKARMSTTGDVRIQGKFSYMAPEKLKGGAGDRRSDIWSLGVVLWEALTLRRLFKGGNDNDTLKLVLDSAVPAPSTVNPEIPRELDAIVMRALERDPDKRYQRARELGRDLEDVLAKLGYGRRNDQIAQYMQATFEAHISARKKVLQEVSSKGRASAAALEAAFDEPPVGPRLSGEFSLRIKRTSELDALGTPPTPHTPSRLGTAEAPPIEQTATAEQAAGEAASIVAVPRRRSIVTQQGLPVIAAIAAVGVILIVVLIATRSGGQELDLAAASSSANLSGSLIDARPEPAPEPVAVAVPDAAVEVAPPVAPDAAVEEPEPPRVRTVVREKPANAVELQREGLKAYVSGDLKTALATLKRAQVASPGYAPTWRTLGLVHEKLGQRGAARLAFQRYLKLAPTASDAATIRARMEQL